ncbi:MAG: zinc-dependent metalloprotease family protein [Candidatus Limimorpha sp.]
MMKSDSTLNFRPFDDGLGNCSFTAYDYSNQIVSYVNQRLSGNEQMHLPPGNATQVLERKYRIILKDVYFHYDDDAYTYNSSSSGHLSCSEINYYSAYPESEINVFFVYDDNINGYQGGGNANMSGNRYVRIKASWQKYRDGGGCDGFWGDSWTLIHEIGHNLGLNHTMHYSSGGCCDYCDDGCSDTPTRHEIIEMGEPDPCPHWGNEGSNYSNNAMDYSGLVAITPQQLGIVHHTLTHDMLLYLEDNYCSINSSVPEHRIANQQSLTWQNNRIMMNNLIIEGGCSLTIKDCWIHIPSNACIIVEPDGELIIDNAIITN